MSEAKVWSRVDQIFWSAWDGNKYVTFSPPIDLVEKSAYDDLAERLKAAEKIISDLGYYEDRADLIEELADENDKLKAEIHELKLKWIDTCNDFENFVSKEMSEVNNNLRAMLSRIPSICGCEKGDRYDPSCRATDCPFACEDDFYRYKKLRERGRE